MAYILNEGPPGRRGGYFTWWLAGGAVLLVLSLVLVFLFARYTPDGASTADGAGAPITWAQVASEPVPVSPVHGPTEVANGLAAGFTQTELGAVLAAVNISTRLSAVAGPAVYETTARLQCVGDIRSTVATIRTQRSSATPGSTTPSEIYYRITGGEPASGLVAISFALETPQSTGMGGYAELNRTVQWIDEDWKLIVPPAPPRLITTVDGYISLGRPHG